MSSIYQGESFAVAMADISHLQFRQDWAFIITKHTTYNTEIDDWMNPVYVPSSEKRKFLAAWYDYREQAEAKKVGE